MQRVTDRDNRDSGCRRRGLTLLEIMIAIALLVALAGLTFPVMLGRLEAGRFESTLDQVTGQLLLTRAHAKSDARPLEVRYVPDRHAFIVRTFDVGDRAFSRGEFLDQMQASADGSADDALDLREQADQEANVFGSWSELEIDQKIHISDARPDLTQPDIASQLELTRLELEQQFGTRERQDERGWRVAAFLGDGSVVFNRTLWVHDEGRRLARVDLNPWSGLPTVQLIEQPDEDPQATPEGEGTDHTDDPDFSDRGLEREDESTRDEPEAANATDPDDASSETDDSSSDDDAESEDDLDFDFDEDEDEGGGSEEGDDEDDDEDEEDES